MEHSRAHPHICCLWLPLSHNIACVVATETARLTKPGISRKGLPLPRLADRWAPFWSWYLQTVFSVDSISHFWRKVGPSLWEYFFMLRRHYILYYVREPLTGSLQRITQGLGWYLVYSSHLPFPLIILRAAWRCMSAFNQCFQNLPDWWPAVLIPSGRHWKGGFGGVYNVFKLLLA